MNQLEREIDQTSSSTSLKPKMRRWWILLGVVIFITGIVGYLLNTPRGQPCWPKPQGSLPLALMDQSTEDETAENVTVRDSFFMRLVILLMIIVLMKII